MMKLPFVSPLLWAKGCFKDSQAVAHLILTKIARNWHVPILQVRNLKLRESNNQVAELGLKLISKGSAFYNFVEKCSSSN